MGKFFAWALIAVMGFGVVGLSQDLGTRDNPIIWLLSPTSSAEVLEGIGAEIAEDIYELTGYYIHAQVQRDHDALHEAMLSADGNVMACLTAEQYVEVTNANPAVQCRLSLGRHGHEYYYTSIYVLREAGYESIADLNGKTWIYNDVGSKSGYVYPDLKFQLEGISPGGIVETGGHTNSVIALLEGQGDFATGYGFPPEAPQWSEVFDEGEVWEWGDPTELWVWDELTHSLFPEDLRGMVRDVRYALANATDAYGDYWEICERVGVLDVIGPIPNDCLAFCEGFPQDVENEIVAAVMTHIETQEGLALWSDPNFYELGGISDVVTTFYNPFRQLMGLPPLPLAGPQDYLLVSLGDIHVEDDEDPGGAGEIYIWSTVQEGGSGLRTNNIYPYPGSYWVECDSGDSLSMALPIYICPWNQTPNRLNLAIGVWDNDETVGWLSDLMRGLADLLKSIHAGVGVAIDVVLNLPVEKLVQLADEDVLAPVLSSWWASILASSDVWGDYIEPAARYAEMARITSELITKLQTYMEAPEAVAYAHCFGGSGVVQPGKTNDWGIPKGRTEVVYPVYDSADLAQGRESQPLTHATFRRVTEPSEPTAVRVTLRKLEVLDNMEGGEPEIFIHTRVTDSSRDVMDLLSDAAIRVLGLDFWKETLLQAFGLVSADRFLVGQQCRLPSGKGEYLNIDDGATECLEQQIFSTDAVGPMLYVEVQVEECDTGGLFEDDVDRIGSLSLLFTADELLALPDGKLEKWYEISDYAKALIQIDVDR